MNITGSFNTRVGDELGSDNMPASAVWSGTGVFISEIKTSTSTTPFLFELAYSSGMSDVFKSTGQINFNASKNWTGKKINHINDLF